MKLKLIAVVMIALLFLTVVPMTAATAKEETTVAYPYYKNFEVYFCDSPYNLGPVAGKIDLDVVAGTYTVHCTRQLEPNTLYQVHALLPPMYDIDLYLYLQTDAQGHILHTSGDVHPAALWYLGWGTQFGQEYVFAMWAAQ